MARQSYTQVDLTRTGGSIPDGIYKARIENFEEGMGPSGYAYWQYRFVITDGPFKGTSLLGNVSCSPAARWKMDEFLNAVDAPEKGRVTGDKFNGMIIRVKVFQQEWDGEMRSKVEKFLPLAGSTGTTSKSSKAPAKLVKRQAVEEEEDEEEDEEEIEEEDEDEDEEEEEIQPKKKAAAKAPAKSSRKAPPPDEDEDEEDEEEEEEDDEEEEDEDDEPHVKAPPVKRKATLPKDAAPKKFKRPF